MAYPARPQLQALPHFAGTASPRPTPEQRAALIAFCRQGYLERGRSLRELAELTDRSQSAVRRALEQGGVALRPPGAPRVTIEQDASP